MPTFIFKKRLELAPRLNTNIYNMNLPRVSEKALIETAGKFGLKAQKSRGKITATRDFLSYSEGSFQIILGRRSGALRFFDRNRWMLDDGKTNINLADAEAVKQAEKVITDFNLISLKDCRVQRVTRLRVGSMQKGVSEVKERTIDIGVLFQRVLDKVPVEGPGGKVMVYCDKDGKITCIDKLWREIGSIKRPIPFSQLRKPELAEKNLRSTWSRNYYSTIEVEDVLFVYYEMSMCEVQRTLQPAYLMPIKMISPNTETEMRSVHVYPAAAKPVGTIIPTKKKMPVEPVRG
jgi:hypothetical protein